MGFMRLNGLVMINAKDEFIETAVLMGVKCAKIGLYQKEPALLKVGFDAKDFNKFLSEIDFDYENNHDDNDLQLFGAIWFTDGSWAVREEVDGSEWWEIHNPPPIYESLQSKIGHIASNDFWTTQLGHMIYGLAEVPYNCIKEEFMYKHVWDTKEPFTDEQVRTFKENILELIEELKEEK